MARYFQNHPTLLTGLKLLFVAAFALAVTVPFAEQAFSHDGALMLDFASSQAEDPLRQHIDNYDYFGWRVDKFTDQHPRFLSLYLSFVIRAAGGISEVPIHVALSVFPVMGGIGMFFLGRRFGVSGLAAALLFLASPIFMVGFHLETADVPGTALWVSSLTAFIYGVDRNKAWLLILAGVLFLLTIFTFFQGLTVLGLALTYLILKKRLGVRTLAPVLAPALLFGGYLYWFFSFYGHLPHFKYRYFDWLELYDRNFLNQLRAFVVIIGGTVLFPLATIAGFLRHWRTALVGLIVVSLAWPWLLTRYQLGTYSGVEALMLGVFVLGGAVVLYLSLESMITGTVAWFKGKNNDVLLLCVWFFGVLAYCIFLLSYPATRYFQPAAPAVILLLLMLWRQTFTRWPSVRAAIAVVAITLTLGFSIVLSLSYMQYANEARDTATWAQQAYGGWDGQVWFNGEFGFAHYMGQNGFKMLPNVRGNRYAETAGPWPPDNAKPGDLIITSQSGGGWLGTPDVLARMRLIETRIIRSGYPVAVVTPAFQKSSWLASFLLPFAIVDRPWVLNEVTVWQVVEEPAPLPPEVQAEVDRWQ